MQLSSWFKNNISQTPDKLNRTNNVISKNINNEISGIIKQKTKEKRVKVNLDLHNKTAMNLKTKKSLKKSSLKSKKSVGKINHNLNLETEKLEKSNLSIFKVKKISYPKSSLNVKNQITNKSFYNNSTNNKSFLGINNNKSFLNKGKYNKTKKNFLKLINPNNINKVHNDSKHSLIFGKDMVDVLEGDSLNLIQLNLQNKIFDMGKEADFLEFETSPLEISRLNLRKKKPKLTIRNSKNEEDKKRNQNSRTVIHKNIFSFGNNNITNSKSDDLLLIKDKNEKTCIYKNKMKFSKKKLGDLIPNNKNNLKKKNINSNISSNFYKINLMKSDVNGRRSSINPYLKSSHSFKSSLINRSKTASHSKSSLIDETDSSKHFSDNINKSKSNYLKRKKLFNSLEKFRILKHRKLVYDSLDDEEIIEDAINVNFYLNPDDKIILVIDSLILFFSFWSIIYKPLNLVLNNCDVKNTFLSLNIDNISNILIDIIFIFDLIINFFKAYYNFDEQLITRSEKIILNYIKGYFILDFICAIPYYSIIKIIKFKTYKGSNIVIRCSKYYDHVINDRYQLVEIIKLIKFLKCVNNKNIVSNYIKDSLNQIAFFGTWSYLLTSAFFSLLVLHLTACIHIFISCTTFPNWIVQKNLHMSHFIKIYLSSIYFLITTVTSVGYGDIIGNSFTEIIFQIFLLIVGIIAYSWLISSLSNYVQENNSQNEVFNQKLAILEDIKLENPKMTKELYDKIYLHLEYTNLKQKKDKSSLIDSLPHSIKKPLLYEMYKPIIENFNFFKKFKNSEFVNRVISKLKPVLAIKNDLLLEQGEIIEDTIFVKQGRLSLEVKIDTDYPEKSIEKLLNEEYFFGLENNEIYKKSALGIMTSINRSLSFINKKNLYNLYAGNDNIQKELKSIVTNAHGESHIQKHISPIINYINLRILDIRKNEHFGALLMFLNKRSPLTLRVKTKKAELFFLKKIDAIEISTSYPNIWKRVNKRAFHNLKQIKKIMKNRIRHFCDAYGIDCDFGTRINNYLGYTKIKQLKRISSKLTKKKSNLKNINNYNILNNLNNQILDPRRASVGILNSQSKMLQFLPKQTKLFTTKTNFEKDIQELIPKNFERNNNIKNNQNNNINKNEIKNKKNNDDISDLKKENNQDNDNPMDFSVSIINFNKKESFEGFNSPKNNNIRNNNNDNKENNGNLTHSNDYKLNNKNNESIYNNLKLKSNNVLPKYGEEEANNLIKFFGTPYYPEDINDEVYPGENFDINSPKLTTNNYFEQNYTSINNNLLLSCDNNLPKIKNKMSQPSLNNIDINNKSNNFTINNNYITNNVINNVTKKSNENLNIFKFSLNIKNEKSNKNINKNNLEVFKNSFEISSKKLVKMTIKSYNTNKIKKRNSFSTKNIKDNNNNKIKKNKSIEFRNKMNNYFNKDNESDPYSSSGSLSCSSFSSNSYSNDNENIFKCEPQIKHKKGRIKLFKTTLKPNKKKKIKNMKISHNIIIKIKSNYENLNMITDGKISKSKKLQNCIKNLLIKKISKHKKEENQENKKSIKTTGLKLVKHKTMARVIPEKFKKNNLYKITTNNDTLRKTDVKSLFKKHMISEIDKNSIFPTNKNQSRFKDTRRYSSSSIPKKAKIKKKSDEFLLDYVNRNIRDDNAVLHNPGQFYNGLFNNIMKKVTIQPLNKK